MQAARTTFAKGGRPATPHQALLLHVPAHPGGMSQAHRSTQVSAAGCEGVWVWGARVCGKVCVYMCVCVREVL